MQIRIRRLSETARETVQRATSAFATPIENVGIDHVAVSNPVPRRYENASKKILCGNGDLGV